jgi:hypothetical protein
VKKKTSPLKGRKWPPEQIAKYRATRAANGWVPKTERSAAPLPKAKLKALPGGVADAILFLRNAELKLKGKARLAESDLLMLLALRSLEGTP